MFTTIYDGVARDVQKGPTSAVLLIKRDESEGRFLATILFSNPTESVVFRSADSHYLTEKLQEFESAFSAITSASNDWHKNNISKYSNMTGLQQSDVDTFTKQLRISAYKLSDALFYEHKTSSGYEAGGLTELHEIILRRQPSEVHIFSSHFFKPWNLFSFKQNGPWFGELAFFRTQHTFRERGVSKLCDWIVGPARPFVAGYADYNALETSVAKAGPMAELAILKTFLGGATFVRELGALPTGQFALSSCDQLLTFLSEKGRRYFHFNCHLEVQNEPSASFHKVSFTDDAHVAQDRTALEVPPDCGILLNMCSSASPLSNRDASLAQRYLDLGFVAVCGTTGAVSDHFSSAFAKFLYDGCDRNETFYAAVLRARMELFQVSKHPLAFLYSFSGDDNFVLKPLVTS
jgi:hypothetical protein